MKGIKYHYASNIAHLNDVKIQLEDQSMVDTNTEPFTQYLLQGGLAALKNHTLQRLPCSNIRVKQLACCYQEEFICHGQRVIRQYFPQFDISRQDKIQYQTAPDYIQCDARAKAAIGQRATICLVQHVMVRIFESQATSISAGKLTKDEWIEKANATHNLLYDDRDNTAFLQELVEDASGVLVLEEDQGS